MLRNPRGIVLRALDVTGLADLVAIRIDGPEQPQERGPAVAASDPLSFAVERAWQAGIVFVVAAGNDGWDSPRLTNPAQDPYVIAVAASQAVDGHESMPAGYSNGSSEQRRPDLAAPGR